MHKILIVDDDPILVDFLKLLMESEGYETAEASDGENALTQIEQFQPEVVLLDYMMPNMDGLDVLKRVCADYNSSFVVMLTGKGSEEVAVECMKAGAVDYVLKPFDNDRLLSVIRNALRYRHSELQKRKMNEDLQSLNEKLNQILNRMAEVLRQIQETGTHARLAELDQMLKDARALLG